MPGKKFFFLFLAFLLPIAVFFFLKIFGRNEFAVEPLFQNELPTGFSACNGLKVPYRIAPHVMTQVFPENDSLAVIIFKNEHTSQKSKNEIARIRKALKREDNITVNLVTESSSLYGEKQCGFLLRNSYDVVLVDRQGIIRGQYVSDNRDEMDRLTTEVDIILKKY